jgi:protein-S-isoprenylcysteine O-methyltransferase Ste14
MISRILVTAVFVLVTGLTAATGYDHIHSAFGVTGGARAWAISGYWIMRVVVMGAFTYFVAVRDEPRKRSRNPLAFAAFAVSLGSVAFLRQPSDVDSTTLVVLGDFVAFGACIWLLASVLALGRCFGVLPEARGLVTRGPYQIVRHPVYVGEFGTFAGFLIAAPTAWNLAVVAAFCVGQAVRMRLEERALTLEFPEYAAYAARTPAVVPGLRRGTAGRIPASRLS